MKIPSITTPAAEGLIGRLCAGTTSKRSDYRVLWIGEHLAIVKWKGGSYHNRGRNYVNGDVSLKDLTRAPTVNRTRAPTVKKYLEVNRSPREWEVTDAEKQGYDIGLLTKAHLAKYIADAEKRDAGWLAERAAAATATRIRRAAEERKRNLEQEVRRSKQVLLVAAEDNEELSGLAADYRAAIAALNAEVAP